MSLQKFPLGSVHKVCQYLQSALVLPSFEDAPTPAPEISVEELTDETLPEPDSLADLGNLFRIGDMAGEETSAPNMEGRWFISNTDLGMIISRLPGIELKPGWRMVTFLRRLPEGGMGITWAVPTTFSTTDFLEKALEDTVDPESPPHPQAALEDFMEAITGDRTHVSFLSASLLRRELLEFGRSGRYSRWRHHRLIDTIPTQKPWTWRMPQPENLAPKVRLTADGRAAVEFFSCRVVAPIAVFRHVDQYRADGYHPKAADRAIAVLDAP